MTSVATIRDYLEQQRSQFDAELDRLLPAADTYPPPIHAAMRHSVLAGGKRLRPILALEAARLFGCESKDVLRLGCALEMIHTFSLIHDDLPALDNDDMRRGKPTLHRAFDEGTAILAGDALAVLAFETLARETRDNGSSAADTIAPSARLRAIRELSHAIGTRDGLLGGQFVDIESTGRAVDASTLVYIHSSKTGAFIAAAVRCGAIYANAPEPDLARLTTYGEKVGLAFQIADDLLDVLGSKEMLGKAVGKDGAQRKATYPALHGVEASQRIAARLVDEASEALALYGSRAERLREIAHYLIARKS